MQKQDATKIWEDIYRNASSNSSGKPGHAIEMFASQLPSGKALELGCAKGDDAIWLASKGWTVLAVDISSNALNLAAGNAVRAGVEDQIGFEQHDLSVSFPTGSFDFVTASFLHSPVAWPRAAALSKAAAAVSSGGHLLIVEHASRAPWSWAAPDTQYPTAQNTLDSLFLPPNEWSSLHVAAIERQASGPDGQTALVRDNVIFLKRN